jgi:hypothetical protein
MAGDYVWSKSELDISSWTSPIAEKVYTAEGKVREFSEATREAIKEIKRMKEAVGGIRAVLDKDLERFSEVVEALGFNPETHCLIAWDESGHVLGLFDISELAIGPDIEIDPADFSLLRFEIAQLPDMDRLITEPELAGLTNTMDDDNDTGSYMVPSGIHLPPYSGPFMTGTYGPHVATDTAKIPSYEPERGWPATYPPKESESWKDLKIRSEAWMRPDSGGVPPSLPESTGKTGLISPSTSSLSDITLSASCGEPAPGPASGVSRVSSNVFDSLKGTLQTLIRSRESSKPIGPTKSTT